MNAVAQELKALMLRAPRRTLAVISLASAIDRAGNVARTDHVPARWEVSRVPPSSLARWVIPSMPVPSPCRGRPWAAGFSTVSATASDTDSETDARLPAECLTTFANDSWAMRYSAAPTGRGSSVTSPATVKSTSTPALR